LPNPAPKHEDKRKRRHGILKGEKITADLYQCEKKAKWGYSELKAAPYKKEQKSPCFLDRQ